LTTGKGFTFALLVLPINFLIFKKFEISGARAIAVLLAFLMCNGWRKKYEVNKLEGSYNEVAKSNFSK
jgi:hypothetical protein